MVEGTSTVVELPLLRDLTYNEAHSALLGLVGAPAGVAFQAGFREVAVGFGLTVVLIAFGLRRMSGETVPVAQRVIRREPWYFMTVFVVSAVAAGAAYGAMG